MRKNAENIEKRNSLIFYNLTKTKYILYKKNFGRDPVDTLFRHVLTSPQVSCRDITKKTFEVSLKKKENVHVSENLVRTFEISPSSQNPPAVTTLQI